MRANTFNTMKTKTIKLEFEEKKENKIETSDFKELEIDIQFNTSQRSVCADCGGCGGCGGCAGCAGCGCSGGGCGN